MSEPEASLPSAHEALSKRQGSEPEASLPSAHEALSKRRGSEPEASLPSEQEAQEARAPVRERIVRWEDPHASAAALRGLTGLEALRAIMAGTIPRPPISALIGMEIIEVEDGRVVFEAEPGEHLYNPIGMVHGGFACTLMDTVMGCSIQSRLPAGVAYTTTDLQVRLIRAILVSTGRVRGEGKAVHVGRSTAVAEGRLTDMQGKLLALGTTGCAILRP
jgi:uncharacterized protein (TIGR00369 family)